jgi:hypothetical protein
MTDEQRLELAKLYYALSSLPTLGKEGSDRLGEILELATEDDELASLLNEIDHRLTNEVNLTRED